MAKIPRPKHELPELFSDQLKVLTNHCHQYDAGEKFYAANIAADLRTLLFHNPPNSHSLLHQLQLENQLFYDTERSIAGGDPKVVTRPAGGLALATVHKIDGELVQEWIPSFLQPEIMILTPFKAWWEADILPTIEGTFTRKRIIRQMANHDRGTHVDPGIEKVYYELTRNDGIKESDQLLIYGDAVSNPNQPIDATKIQTVSQKGAGMKIARALVRQIAHEVFLTFTDHNEPYLSKLTLPSQGIAPVAFASFTLT